MVEGICILSAMNESSANKKKKKKPLALVRNLDSKEVRSCWGFGRQLRGIVGDNKLVNEQLICAKCGLVKDELLFITTT